MAFQPNITITLENFDDAWGLGDPIAIENKFQELLSEAESLPDKSIYLQILSQLALAQAIQKKFDEAHKTLDKAEVLLTPEYDLAHARILLERGRTFQQAGKIAEARNYYEQSYELSKKNNLDFHTINAAHMLAIIAEKPENKIEWNQRSLDLALKTKDKRAEAWQGPLYNNLGRNYLEASQFENALSSFQKALEYREKEGYAPNIRVAKWQIGSALRLLNRLDEALNAQLALDNEYAAISASGKYDIPIQMFTLTRGLIYEEITDIYLAKARGYAKLAYDDLSQDEMFRTTEAGRLERLKQIKS